MKRKTVEKKCLNCDKKFEAKTSELARGFAKFCSLTCSAKFNRRNRPKSKPNVQCALCNKEFYKKKSSLKNSRSGLFFCCRNHKDQAQKLGGIKEIMPPHYGTAAPENNYRAVAFKKIPKVCNRCSYKKYPQIFSLSAAD